MIAVLGATGQVGSEVLSRLAAHGTDARAIVRDASRAPGTAREFRVAADYRDTAAMTTALRGCRVALLVSGRESADRMADHRSIVTASTDAGVERVVYVSFQSAAADCTFTFGRDHWHTEQLIRASGMQFTFLRDNFYQGALASMCGADGELVGPAGDGRVAAVTQEDVAAVAAVALRSHDLTGQTLDLTGPSALTMTEVTDELTRVTGRPISYRDETVEQAYASRQHFGAPEFEVTGWVTSYLAIANGDLASVSDAVPAVLGRPAEAFADYLRRRPDLWSHLRRS